MAAVVVYLVRDLLFTSKIRETARQLGAEVESARDLDALATAARSARLVIIDLRLPEAMEALDRIGKTTAVGFIDHERTDVMEQAREKGCTALAKGKFAVELPRLIERALQ